MNVESPKETTASKMQNEKSYSFIYFNYLAKNETIVLCLWGVPEPH